MKMKILNFTVSVRTIIGFYVVGFAFIYVVWYLFLSQRLPAGPQYDGKDAANKDSRNVLKFNKGNRQANMRNIIHGFKGKENYAKDLSVKKKSDRFGIRRKKKQHKGGKVKSLVAFHPTRFNHGAAIFDLSVLSKTTFKSLRPGIPHIIHQFWSSTKIPEIYKPWIKSMVKKHPTWDYWFWTWKDVKCLIKKKYPREYKKFMSYKKGSFRTSIVKYFILQQLGGFYVNLEMESLKSLDFWTYTRECVLSWENYVQTFFVFGHRNARLSGDVFGCKPNHRFMKMLLKKLPLGRSRVRKLPSSKSFLLNTYNTFLKSNESKSLSNNVLTIHPKYWSPMWYSKQQKFNLKSLCQKVSGGLESSEHQRHVCKTLLFRNFTNTAPPDSFVIKHWDRSVLEKKIKKNAKFKITEAVPNVILASKTFKC